MYRNSQFFSFWVTHKVCLISLLFAYGTAQTTYNERGLVGGEVILPCDYNQANDGTLITLTWTVTVGGSSANLYIRAGGTTANQITPPAQYDGRVELVDDVKLKLTGIQIEDERQYRCAVTASLNSETSFVNLQVFVAVQIYEEVGQSVTLTCDYSFSGARYTLEWHRGDERLLNFFSEDDNPTFDSTDLSGRLSLQDGKNLVISNLRRTDDGRYHCRVSEVGGNPSGDGSDQNVIVSVSPSVILAPSASAITGSDVTLTCTVDSKPEANITWTGPNGDLGTGKSVMLINVQAANDTGCYMCTATNSFSATKSASGSVALIVQGPNITPAPQTEANCSGPGVVAGAAVGCFIGGLLVGGAAVLLFLRFRTARNGGGEKETNDPANRQYENVAPSSSRAAPRPGSGSDEYEFPMETIQPPPQPPQPSDDYQELRPAIYQSLQEH